MIPKTDHYWLLNAQVPVPLLADSSGFEERDLAAVNLEIKSGQIGQILAASSPIPPDLPFVDLHQGQVWPCFVDLHTHLDKGHIWPRHPNPDGSFNSALTAAQGDHAAWNAEDLYRRMEFGLKCAYAHGSSAIRTHLDIFGEPAPTSLAAFSALRRDWADRLTMQAAALVSLDYYLTPAGEQLADQMAEVNGCLGGLPMMGADLETQLDRLFALAQERQLDLDFHTDESGNPADVTLRYVAEAAIRHNFTGQIVCGHCCSLAVQSAEPVLATLNWVKQANIGIVSLPMCNLYLQDRNQSASAQFTQAVLGEPLADLRQMFTTQTPRWRGVTLVHELKQFGIPVAFASDNCRDPFYAYGDHDGYEVFSQAVRIAQLDAPYSNWCQSVTTIPADLMGLPAQGRIGVGLPADLILFKARSFSELLARTQTDRQVLRLGQLIDSRLPDYAELDDLMRL
jgi:cytosine/creatinine deaminase